MLSLRPLGIPAPVVAAASAPLSIDDLVAAKKLVGPPGRYV